MLDRDLAELYATETKVLNQAVKRNLARFPEDFMFQLTDAEWQKIEIHVNMREKSDISLRSQIVTSKSKGGLRYLPYVFTEQGVAMLSSVLHSSRAVQMNIAIMRAFVEMRKLALQPFDIAMHLQQIIKRLDGHDVQLNTIFEALENLLDETAAQKKWDSRDRIGFRNN